MKSVFFIALLILGSVSASPVTCLEDIAKLGPGVFSLIKDIEAKDFSKVI